jgi:hypothetical protein
MLKANVTSDEFFRKKYYTYCSTDFINHCSIEPRHPKALAKGCSKHDSGRAERRLKDKARYRMPR